MMYGAPKRRTTHHLARLNLPSGSWIRASAECPSMYALESAMDELAVACGIDPIKLRVRNEPDVDPKARMSFSPATWSLAYVLEGAERFGWVERDPTPGIRLVGR